MEVLGLSVALIAFLVVLSGVVIVLATVLVQLWWWLPFVPTPMPIVRTMVRLAALRPGDVVVDLGAGDGRLLLEAERAVNGIRATGYELALGVWLLAVLRLWISGSQTRVLRRDLFRADLRDADVVFLYLLPHVLERLMPKLRAELRPGTRVISHAFALPGQRPTERVPVPLRFKGMTAVSLYVWAPEALQQRG